MTNEVISNAFDTLLNSYASKSAMGDQDGIRDIRLDEYEKSVFLTISQEQLVKEIYTGKYTGEGFESSEKVRRELEALVTQKDYTSADAKTEKSLKGDKYKHSVFKLESDLLYIVYEQVKKPYSEKCSSSIVADVVPVSHDEYWRVQDNPFRGPNNRRVLRLDNNNGQVELVSTEDIEAYTMRYLKKPNPIILIDLDDSTACINGKNEASSCELDSMLYNEILDRAVRLALASKAMTINKDNGE